MFSRLDACVLARCEPRRIGIVKPSALGDVVQSLPILEGLRVRWPTAAITWVIRDDLADLVNGHPLVDDWLPYERRRGRRAFIRLLHQLRSRRFDLVIDLQGLLRTGLMTLATGAALRVGLETAREGSALACNIVLPGTGRDAPAHARYRRLIEVIGVDAPPAEWSGTAENPGGTAIPVCPKWFAGDDLAQTEMSVPPCNRAVTHHEVASRLASFRRSDRPATLAVHPGALWASKRWPLGRFAAVASRAARERDMRIVVVGSPQERNRSRSLVESVRATVPSADLTDLTGTTSIAELRSLLQQVDLLLTNDSGPMHLAASVGTPVVGVFTSTSPVLSGPPLETGPGGPRHQLVATPTPCAGCYRRRCPLVGQRHNACQRDLSVDRVWQALVTCVRQNERPGVAAITPTAEPAQGLLTSR